MYFALTSGSREKFPRIPYMRNRFLLAIYLSHLAESGDILQSFSEAHYLRKLVSGCWMRLSRVDRDLKNVKNVVRNGFSPLQAPFDILNLVNYL